MMKDLIQLQQAAQQIRDAYQTGSVTPSMVGGLASDTLTYISMLEQNLQALGIRKTYATEADMNADTAPMGDNGMPIRFGQLVMVTAAGKIYSYQAPGWKAVSDAALPVSIGNVVGKRGDRLGNVLGDIGVADPSVEGFTLNDYTTSGTYRIMGDRTNGNDGMPIANEGGGHRVDAVLTVLDASISSSEACVTQMLVLSNRVAGDGNMYIRTAKGTMAEIQSGAKWETWQKMVGQWEKGMVADATELDTWTESGMYSAMMTAQSSTRGLTFNPGDTLFVVTINGYDSERLSSTITAQCTQFLYRLPAYYGGVNTGVAKAEQYVGTGLWTGSRYSWGDWKRLADSDDVAQLSKNINTNTKEIKDLQKEIATKQQELTLTVLDNGNIRIGNLQGQTKDFMPATPSGDPMHYAYEALGAVYNSGADVITYTPWYSLVDDADYNAKWGLNLIPDNATFVKTLKYNNVDREVWQMKHPNKNFQIWVVAEYASDGTKIWDDTLVVKRSGMWYMDGLGDLTNSDMRLISNDPHPVKVDGSCANNKGRTLKFNNGLVNMDVTTRFLYANENVEVWSRGYNQEFSSSNILIKSNIRHIINAGIGIYNAIIKTKLEVNYISTLFMSVGSNIVLDMPNISAKSIIKLIENTTDTVTITFPSALYDRLMDTSTTLGAELVALLESKSNITFARGE